MKLKFLALFIPFSWYQLMNPSHLEYAQESDYFLKHPFGDVYSVVDPNPSKKYLNSLATMTQSTTSVKSRPNSAFLPPIESKPNTARTGRRSAAIFPEQLDLQKLSSASPHQEIINLDEATSNSSRSYEMSDITTNSPDISTSRTLSSSLSEEETTIEEAEFSMSGSSKFKKTFSRKKSTSSSSENPARKYTIAPTPEIWLTNNKNHSIQITIYLRTPFDKDSYDPYDSASYNASSQKITIEPAQQIKVSVPAYSRLQSMQLAYDPVPQAIKTQHQIYQSRASFNFAANNLTVGEKQYAHDIAINDDGMHIDKVSSVIKTPLIDLPLKN